MKLLLREPLEDERLIADGAEGDGGYDYRRQTELPCALFFDKRPGGETASTQKLWIYDLRTNKHFTLKTGPLKREDLDEFVECYNVKNRHNWTPTWFDESHPHPSPLPAEGEGTRLNGRWRAYDYDELISRDKASRDLFWLKDDSLEDSTNLPAPDVIAREIVDDLEAAFEQFRLIANDLGFALKSGGEDEDAKMDPR